MSGPTIHQRVSGWLWHWRDGPGWVRDGSEMAKLRQDGMRVLKVQLQDDTESSGVMLSPEQTKEWRDAGLQVWGAVGHVDGLNPWTLAAWLKAERVRLSLTGFDCNFEEDVRAHDEETGGIWSTRFATEARRLMPTLPMHIDTYYGSAAASPGINLGAFLDNGFRLCLQSYWGDGIFDDSPTRMVKWTSEASPPWPKAKVKPLHRVVKPGSGTSAGQLPNWDYVFANQWVSGLKGIGWYHIDGADFDLIRWLTREAIRRGCAY